MISFNSCSNKTPASSQTCSRKSSHLSTITILTCLFNLACFAYGQIGNLSPFFSTWSMAHDIISSSIVRMRKHIEVSSNSASFSLTLKWVHAVLTPRRKHIQFSNFRFYSLRKGWSKLF